MSNVTIPDENQRKSEELYANKKSRTGMRNIYTKNEQEITCN
jgi:hypothetical protein